MAGPKLSLDFRDLPAATRHSCYRSYAFGLEFLECPAVTV